MRQINLIVYHDGAISQGAVKATALRKTGH